ncbi:MAG: tetratricopeptide repeat protein [Gammaproteobacteria bacterium]|jgi:tetratricopeptide (TPR) repeat protein|nr:tetratricopeptide repeat protein [Gammaproteobacteria bacterium]MBT5223591.1 tetratricopeptide repeat protein [Gammaproteobacteria bacterium]MBT5827222.1 tetratricopeptide repeat protein [Gammaproteobacteria bacterium]MBT5966973.1 tetratricopeptide repeat protein [Gammaproteobacteria bacterium]MBT6419639.1 tetratricopeptide repeat protein [Gammaproteobacteria bacterium]
MVLKVMMLLSFLILSACVSKSSQSLSNAPETANKTALGSDEKQERKTEISSDVLFLLMTAEIAGQRGQYDLALDGYMRASERVKDIDVIKRAAKIALYVRDDAKLKQAVDMWLEEEPDSLGARYLVAVAALNSGDRETAFTNTEFVLLQDDNNFDAQAISIVKQLTGQQSMDLAYQVFADLNAKYPDNAKLYFVLALMDVQTHKLRPAQDNVGKALAIEPQWKRALLLQSQLFITQGKLAAATEALQQIDELEKNEQIKEQVAQLLIQQGRFSEAEEILQEMIKKYSDNHELQFKLALVYLQTEQSEAARTILQDLVVDQEYKDRAAFYLGSMDGKAKQNGQALVWFDSIGAGPYQYDAGVSAILILMDEKRYQEAGLRINGLKTEFSGKSIDLALLEAEVYAQQDLDQQGFDVLTSALVNAPNNNKILYARALIAEKLGKLQILEDDLKYILEKDPDDANTLNALGYTLVDKTTRYDEAQIYLDKALAIKPHEPIIMDSYGWLLFKQGRLEEARKYLQRAYDLEPRAEIAGHLIEVLFALQQDKQAKELLGKALAKDPGDTYLLELEARLLSGN